VIRDQALENAVIACESALADYQAGLLDDTELRRKLERAGVVHTDAGSWFLDIESGHWRRYVPVPPDLSFDARTVRRWRAGLRQLMAPAPDPARSRLHASERAGPGRK
jgi:hypothetical protein